MLFCYINYIYIDTGMGLIFKQKVPWVLFFSKKKKGGGRRATFYCMTKYYTFHGCHISNSYMKILNKQIGATFSK